MRTQRFCLLVGIFLIALLTVGVVEAAGEVNLMTGGATLFLERSLMSLPPRPASG